MPDTVLNSRRRIRLLVDDLNMNQYAIDSPRLTIIMENRMHLTAAEVGLGNVWVTSAVTLAANDYEYTLPTSVQYNRVMALRLTSQEWLLERVTPAEFLALQDGSGEEANDPTHYALFEDTSQQVNIWLHPTPAGVDTLDVLRSQVPAALSTDATNISFSDPLLRAFEKSCAIDAVLLMDEEERAKRKAVLDQVGRWDQEVKRALSLERVRIGNLRRSDRIPQKWV